VDNQVIIAQDKDDTEYKTKIEALKQQRWGLNVDILKTEYLSVASDIQNIKLQHNIEIKGSRPSKCLGSIVMNLENATKTC
jgi:hypothetical protein